MDDWIVNSSTIFVSRDEIDTFRSLELLSLNDESDQEETTTISRIGKSYESIFQERDIYAMQCKHFETSKKLYIPRSFQHHKLSKIMRINYELQGYELRKNFQCPKSACLENHEDIISDSSSHSSSHIEQQNLTNLVTYRYMRVNKSANKNAYKKQVMCRLCAGVNWVDTTNYFKHLFLAHGLISRFDKSTSWYQRQHKKLITREKIENYFTFYVECIRSHDLKFCRDIFQLLQFEALPVPLRYYSDLMKSGFRRTHVMCPYCKRYIRIGWCEHDEIIRRQFEDFESFNISTFKEYARLSYVQTRKRDEVEGLYENYFVHYIECNFSKYESTCLYVSFMN